MVFTRSWQRKVRGRRRKLAAEPPPRRLLPAPGDNQLPRKERARVAFCTTVRIVLIPARESLVPIHETLWWTKAELARIRKGLIAAVMRTKATMKDIVDEELMEIERMEKRSVAQRHATEEHICCYQQQVSHRSCSQQPVMHRCCSQQQVKNHYEADDHQGYLPAFLHAQCHHHWRADQEGVAPPCSPTGSDAASKTAAALRHHMSQVQFMAAGLMVVPA
ncbi:unnamed protein product [Chrysoparadoxa australica]